MFIKEHEISIRIHRSKNRFRFFDVGLFCL